MNTKDIEVISYIRNNGRASVEDISRELGLPVIDTLTKIKQYEIKIIRNYTCIVDFSKLGFKVNAEIRLIVRLEDQKKFERFINKNKNVNSAYSLENEGEYLVEVLFKKENELNDFIEDLGKKFNLLEVRVHRVKEELKREALKL